MCTCVNSSMGAYMHVVGDHALFLLLFVSSGLYLFPLVFYVSLVEVLEFQFAYFLYHDTFKPNWRFCLCICLATRGT